MKRKALLLASLIFFVFSIAFTSASSDVAYIYKNHYDKNILNVFSEMNLSYQLINEKNLPSDFSNYKMIFVGDEIYSHPEKIPVGQKPTIIANYYNGALWGLTDSDGISKLASSSPLSVRKNNQIIQVYTQAFYSIGGEAIPYYYLDKENKAEGMLRIASTWVGTPETGSSSQFGDVISYGNPGIHLANNVSKEKICFFGIIESNYWTQAAKNMFKDCVEFVGITCSSSSDCGQGTKFKYCQGKSIYQNTTSFSCNLPGTTNSKCISSTKKELIKTCEDLCLNGECKGVQCVKDSDCGINSYSQPYCFNNDSYRDFHEFSCKQGSCIENTTKVLLNKCAGPCLAGACKTTTCKLDSECGENHFLGNKYCKDGNLYQDFISFKCENSSCSNYTKSILLEHCEGTCINNSCITCSSNQSCGTNHFVDGKFCQGKSIYQNYQEFECINPSTPESDCFSKIFPKFIEACSDSCFNGTCINLECHNDSDCQDNLFCNGQEKCLNGECISGNSINCTAFNIAKIESCNNTPDNNSLTFDFFSGFTSVCNENLKACTSGILNLTHKCDSKCGAECSPDSNCTEKCTSTHKLYTNSECEDCKCKYSDYQCVIGKCGAQCASDSDCKCHEDYCNGTTRVDYPDQSTCGTSGSQGCLCQQCEPVLIPDSPLCQVTPVCVKNEDCGESSFNDSSSYCKDNKVYKKRTYYNKECLSGSCFSSTSVEEIKVSECSFGCLNGGCIFECSKNSDCGINRYSDPYCLNNDAYHLVFNYSCTYGKCIKNVSEEIVKDCGNDEITLWKPECDGNNLWNVREKIGNGCLDGFCFHKSDFQKQYLDYCDFGCENGACSDSSCPL